MNSAVFSAGTAMGSLVNQCNAIRGEATLRTPEAADPRFSEISAGATKQCRRPEPGRPSQSKSAMTGAGHRFLETCLTEAREAAKPQKVLPCAFWASGIPKRQI